MKVEEKDQAFLDEMVKAKVSPEEKEKGKAVPEEKATGKAAQDVAPTNATRKRGRPPFDAALATPGCPGCERRVKGLAGGAQHTCPLRRSCA